jgi:hypothetical protein
VHRPSSKSRAAVDESQRIENSSENRLSPPAACHSYSPKYEEAIRNTDWACLVRNRICPKSDRLLLLPGRTVTSCHESPAGRGRDSCRAKRSRGPTSVQGDKTPLKSLVLSSAPSDDQSQLYNGSDCITQCLLFKLCKNEG